MVADLPPVGAGLERPRHGLFAGHAAFHGPYHLPQGLALVFGPLFSAFFGLRGPLGVGLFPAPDAGFVDDPAQADRPADHRAARCAELLGDLGRAVALLLQYQQALVPSWRPGRFHVCSRGLTPVIWWKASVRAAATAKPGNRARH